MPASIVNASAHVRIGSEGKGMLKGEAEDQHSPMCTVFRTLCIKLAKERLCHLSNLYEDSDDIACGLLLDVKV